VRAHAAAITQEGRLRGGGQRSAQVLRRPHVMKSGAVANFCAMRRPAGAVQSRLRGLCALLLLLLCAVATDAAAPDRWQRYPGADCSYDDIPCTGAHCKGYHAAHCRGSTVAECKALCVATLGCGGFNYPHGVLKKTDCLSHKAPQGGCVLYILESSPQPTPAAPAWGTVWPVPQRSEWRHDGQHLTIAAGLRISVDPSSRARGSARLRRAVQRYTDIIAAPLLEKQRVHRRLAVVNSLVLQVGSADESLNARTNASYTLSVRAGAAMATAPTIYGAMYAMETFSQLATGGTAGHINASSVSIVDWPTYHHRSFLADTGRRFWPVRTIKTLLDAMAAVKLNVLHLHLSDNCRYAIQSDAFPLLTKRLTGNLAGSYSKADVAVIVSYAADRGIRVIPEADMPGHAQGLQGLSGHGLNFCLTKGNVTHTHQPYGELANDPGGQTIATMQAIYAELADLFPDDELFIGGDEVSVAGNCTLADYSSIERAVSAKITAPSVQGGLRRTVGGWEEYAFETAVVPATAVGNYVVNTWHYHTQFESTARGWPTVASNDSHFYLVYGGGYQQYWVDIASGMNESQRALLRGGSISAWADEYCYIAYCIHEGQYPAAHALFPPSADDLFHQSIIAYSFPRAAVGAGSFWNYVPDFKASGGTFEVIYAAMNSRLMARGVPSCPTECHCDAASRCGKPYVNETVPPVKTLTKKELLKMRPGRALNIP
jgi:hypothetical protein